MKRMLLALGSLLPVLAFAQFTGRVVNENNDGVPYASVTIKKTTTGAITDSSGRFSIDIDQQQFPFSLIITSTGYEARELVIRNSTVNNVLVQLQPLYQKDTIIITSRRRRELLQNVPIPISVLTRSLVEDAGA